MGQFNRNDYDGLVLNEVRDGTVAAAFTERTGGASESPYASLNLGSHVGDDLAAVMENRRRVLAALGCAGDFERLLVPNQVHGDCVAVVREGSDDELTRVREQIAEGADAIVCAVAHVPVMLCFADCVPVVLTCPGGFAVIHSGWKGTIARISAKAASILCETAACPASSVRAYIGPHILGDEYEVSQELMERFCAEFPGDAVLRRLRAGCAHLPRRVRGHSLGMEGDDRPHLGQSCEHPVRDRRMPRKLRSGIYRSAYPR